MIKYQLRCDADHEFEGWFANSSDFDEQSAGGLLSCPVCGTGMVAKAIMSPAVASSEARSQRLDKMRKSMAHAVARARDYVEKNFDYVGERFPEEARKIHYGETPARGIYGEASGKEVKELVEEGVDVAPLPGSAVAEDVTASTVGRAKPGRKAKALGAEAPSKKVIN